MSRKQRIISSVEKLAPKQPSQRTDTTLGVVLRGLLLWALIAAPCSLTQAQTFKTLFDFASDPTGPTNPEPLGLLVQGRDGNIYGTSQSGGTNGKGVVFQVTPDGTLRVIYNFAFDASPGFAPTGGLTLGTDGNFYGTTSSATALNYGSVFKITSSGHLTVLYKFLSNGDAAAPVQGRDGNWYGTTSGGVLHPTVYRLTPSGHIKTIYTFTYSVGADPQALILGTDGNFYGNAEVGGANGYGSVFRITPAGKLTVLHNFDSTQGANPTGPLVQGYDGNFYGTAKAGGAFTYGVIYRITPSGEFTDLHDFSGTFGDSDGVRPYAGLTLAPDGFLYGATANGGTKGKGTLFKIDSSGSYTKLYDLTNSDIGWEPEVTLLQNTNGIFYGDTYTSIPPQDGIFYSFDAGNQGRFASLVPAFGKVGKSVGILGQGLTGTAAVSFNGVPASFTISSDTFLTAAVPAGATTGFVTVSTPAAVVTSNRKFQVIPDILSFDPSSGTIGTSVIITGASLAQTRKVIFGGVQATAFSVDSDSQVTATVPSGAVTGKIVIATPGGTATSPSNFTVLP